MVRACVVYCRISKDAGLGLGVARQEADCRAACEARGWPVAEVIVDNDVSAYSGKRRAGYERLLAGIGDGTWDALIVWHPDRLHRSPKELEHFIDVVEATGVAVVSVTSGDFDLSTPEGRLTARIVGSVARKESEDKSRRLRRKHVELAQDGKLSGGGRRPFGFEPDRLTVREAEAAEIRSAAARVLAGESLRSIVRDWEGRVPSVSGAGWSPTTVKRLLLSGRIAGQREHRGAIVGAAAWPAIIDPDDSLRLRAVLKANSSGPGGVTARSYLLTGWVHCGACGTRMTTRPVIRKGHKYRRYVCTVDRGGCGRVGIGAERLEELVAEDVLDQLDGPLFARERQVARTPRPVPVDEIAELEARSSELLEMWVAGQLSKAEWAGAKAAVARRMCEAQSVVAAAVQDEGRRSGVTAPVTRASWAAMALDRRRAVIDGMVERIDIASTTRADNRFNEGRVSVVWRS